MNDLLVVLVLGVIASGVYLIVDSLIGLFGKKKLSEELDILLLERRNGNEYNSDER